jgi:uncharacterized protein YigA (DUF484 family)
MQPSPAPAKKLRRRLTSNTVANQLAESERRFEALTVATQRQTRTLALLDKVRAAIGREQDLSDVFRVVVESSAAAFGYPLVSLYLLQADVLVLQHQVGYTNVVPRVPTTRGVIWPGVSHSPGSADH